MYLANYQFLGSPCRTHMQGADPEELTQRVKQAAWECSKKHNCTVRWWVVDSTYENCYATGTYYNGFQEITTTTKKYGI